MTIPAGYRLCKACNKQFKKWSSKDTANYCPSCVSSRLTRQQAKVQLRYYDGSKEKDEKLRKKQERKTAEDKEYWEEQEKRKDPDYLSDKGRKKKYFPKSFEKVQRNKKKRRIE